MTDNQDFVTYETAKQIKERGFDELCEYYYLADYSELMKGQCHNHNDIGLSLSAPHIYQAQKWLREKYGLHISVNSYLDYSEDTDGRKCDEWRFWDYDIMSIANGKVISNGGFEFATYEQALQEGVCAALELIKPEKEQ